MNSSSVPAKASRPRSARRSSCARRIWRGEATTGESSAHARSARHSAVPSFHGDEPQRVEVGLHLEVAVAALPRGHRVAVDGVHLDVDGEQVVARLRRRARAPCRGSGARSAACPAGGPACRSARGGPCRSSRLDGVAQLVERERGGRSMRRETLHTPSYEATCLHHAGSLRVRSRAARAPRRHRHRQGGVRRPRLLLADAVLRPGRGDGHPRRPHPRRRRPRHRRDRHYPRGARGGRSWRRCRSSWPTRTARRTERAAASPARPSTSAPSSASRRPGRTGCPSSGAAPPPRPRPASPRGRSGSWSWR